MMTEEQKNTLSDNAGHRSRVQQRFLMSTDYSYLQDYELLELILMKVIPRRDVKPLSKALLHRFGNLSKVFKAPIEELRQVIGISDSTVVLFKAVVELNCRILSIDLKNANVYTSWEKLLDFCCLSIQDERIEKFLVVYMNSNHHIIRHEIMQHGSKDQVTFYPDEIFRRAVVLSATKILIAHNHPSGSTDPSRNDLKITGELFKILNANGMELLDHLIVGTGRKAYSFSQHGQICANPLAMVQQL